MTAVSGTNSLSIPSATASTQTPVTAPLTADDVSAPDFAGRLFSRMDQVSAGVAALTSEVFALKAVAEPAPVAGGGNAGCRCGAQQAAAGANSSPSPDAATGGATVRAGGGASQPEPADDDGDDDKDEHEAERSAPAPIDTAAAVDLRSRIVDIARAEVGVRETGGEDRGERIETYRTAVRGPGENPRAAEAWCADFASWVARQAGVPIGSGGVGYDFVPQIVDWAKQNGRWRSRSDGPSGPGDLVIYSFRKQRPDHVAVVVEAAGSTIRTVGGNEGDAVREQRRSTASVVGYVRIA